jgi:N-acyl-D-amino-acid deacylase
MAYIYVEALQEALDTAARAQVPLHISHIQAHGIENWDKVHRILKIMEDARTQGVDITGDAHPYLAASTFLKVLLPPWTHDGGSEQLVERLKSSETRDRIRREMKTRMDYENIAKAVSWNAIVIATFPAHPEYQGKTLEELAQLRNQDPYDALFDILIDGGTEATMVVHALNFEQKATILAHPLVMVISDALGVTYGEGKPHPRCYGTFPRVLAEYVREKQILRLEEAIHKMTAFPAHRLGLRSRGLLTEGMAADIVIFDPQKISDNATFENPHQYPTGIEYVLVNGTSAVAEGQLTGKAGGKVLRRGID